jgi:hydrogenase expression/formation protein HypC
VSLACLPEARVGDRVLVHVGVALSLVHDDP